VLGGKFSFEGNPVKAAHLMMAHMDKKRAALKLRPLMYGRSFLEPGDAVSAESSDAAAASEAPSGGVPASPHQGCAGKRPASSISVNE